jgi:methanogenic corrinoid protein MtbC1
MKLNQNGLQASRILKDRRQVIAERVTELFFAARPQLEQHWQDARLRTIENNGYHLDYLSAALSMGRPVIFSDYAVWAATHLALRNISNEMLAFDLELMSHCIELELGGENRALTIRYLNAAVAAIGGSAISAPSGLDGSELLDILAREYLVALLAGRRRVASRLILSAVESGTSVKDIYLMVFERVQREIGRLWHLNQIGIAQEHFCTACTQFIMSLLYPRVYSMERKGRRLVATCVGGDLHEIGLRMVADFFEMEGWDTFYLAANTPISGTLQQVAERAPDVLAISATMLYNASAVADLIAATRAAGNPPHILVGGAPFNSVPGLWKDVGADGYARDAAEAITVANSWFE